MKILAIGTIAFAVTLCQGTTSAGEISLISNVEACESEIPQDKAALVQARRTGNVVILDVTAQLNCAYVPDKPKLHEWRSAATVALPTKSPSGAAAMCLCTHKLSFEITDLYEGVQTIYYVQDGTALGHADAP